MSKEKMDWSVESAALASDDYRLNIPVASITYEAESLAKFVRAHQKADKKTGLPGLAGAKFSLTIADEIESLAAEVTSAQKAYTLTVDPKADTTKIERARFLVDEIYAVMAYLLDDGVENEEDARLANVVSAHKDEAETPANMALALEEYAGLAKMHAKEIDGLGGFDAALIGEAEKLAVELRKSGPTAPPSAESAAALAKRNRLLQLLDVRVRKVRAAARFVFRAHPDVVRQVTSPYERKRRIDAKRAATRKKNSEAAAKPVAPHA
ncbi:MAG: hypothetical protein ACXVCJ_26145 [Polyangiales bacterium]